MGLVGAGDGPRMRSVGQGNLRITTAVLKKRFHGFCLLQSLTFEAENEIKYNVS